MDTAKHDLIKLIETERPPLTHPLWFDHYDPFDGMDHYRTIYIDFLDALSQAKNESQLVTEARVIAAQHREDYRRASEQKLVMLARALGNGNQASQLGRQGSLETIGSRDQYGGEKMPDAGADGNWEVPSDRLRREDNGELESHVEIHSSDDHLHEEIDQGETREENRQKVAVRIIRGYPQSTIEPNLGKSTTHREWNVCDPMSPPSNVALGPFDEAIPPIHAWHTRQFDSQCYGGNIPLPFASAALNVASHRLVTSRNPMDELVNTCHGDPNELEERHEGLESGGWEEGVDAPMYGADMPRSGVGMRRYHSRRELREIAWKEKVEAVDRGSGANDGIMQGREWDDPLNSLLISDKSMSSSVTSSGSTNVITSASSAGGASKPFLSPRLLRPTASMRVALEETKAQLREIEDRQNKLLPRRTRPNNGADEGKGGKGKRVSKEEKQRKVTTPTIGNSGKSGQNHPSSSTSSSTSSTSSSTSSSSPASSPGFTDSIRRDQGLPRVTGSSADRVHQMRSDQAKVKLLRSEMETAFLRVLDDVTLPLTNDIHFTHPDDDIRHVTSSKMTDSGDGSRRVRRRLMVSAIQAV